MREGAERSVETFFALLARTTRMDSPLIGAGCLQGRVSGEKCPYLVEYFTAYTDVYLRYPPLHLERSFPSPILSSPPRSSPLACPTSPIDTVVDRAPSSPTLPRRQLRSECVCLCPRCPPASLCDRRPVRRVECAHPAQQLLVPLRMRRSLTVKLIMLVATNKTHLSAAASSPAP